MSSARPWAELEEQEEVAGVREKAALTPNKARASLSAPRTAKKKPQKTASTGKAFAVQTQTDKLTNDS